MRPAASSRARSWTARGGRRSSGGRSRQAGSNPARGHPGMRRPDAHATRHLVAGLVLAALLTGPLAGCSRLTFVKADPNRGDYVQVAPEYKVREGKDEQRRTLALSLAAAASEALQAGRLGEAEAEARKALDNDRGSSEAHTVLALVAERRGDAKTAGKHYEKAVELAPRRGTTLNNYGAWLCGNGR